MTQDEEIHTSSRNYRNKYDNDTHLSDRQSHTGQEIDGRRAREYSTDRRMHREERSRRDHMKDEDRPRERERRRSREEQSRSGWKDYPPRRRRSRSHSGSRRSTSPKRSTRDEPRERRRERERGRDDTYERYSRRQYRSNSRPRSPGSARNDNDPKRGEHSTRPSRSKSRSRSPTSRSSKPPEDKAKPNFKPSGLLAAETNAVKRSDGTTTVLKYNEPPEARRPNVGWRLYVFKEQDQTDMLHVHKQSCYLIGRDRMVADIPLEHPSCSKQHAVIQHRNVPQKDQSGTIKSAVKPFIIDLESTNGTHVNGEQIPTSRYYELRAGDVIKFGLSNREYVLMHDEA